MLRFAIRIFSLLLIISHVTTADLLEDYRKLMEGLENSKEVKTYYEKKWLIFIFLIYLTNIWLDMIIKNLYLKFRKKINRFQRMFNTNSLKGKLWDTDSEKWNIFRSVLSNNCKRSNTVNYLTESFDYFCCFKGNRVVIPDRKIVFVTARCTGSWEILARGEGQSR